MQAVIRAVAIAVAVADLVVGAFALFWPGAWQELLHPEAMGTTFYHLQRAGTVWLVRSGVAIAVAVRPGPGAAVVLAGLLSVEGPADLLLAWQAADTGALAAPLYALRGALGLGAAGLLWRARGGR
jgi:hypothetical protein